MENLFLKQLYINMSVKRRDPESIDSKGILPVNISVRIIHNQLNHLFTKFKLIMKSSNYNPLTHATNSGNSPSLEISKLRLKESAPPSFLKVSISFLSITSIICSYLIVSFFLGLFFAAVFG